MATFTSNYGLHQWEPSDNFLRTDFNEDLKKIDTALGGKANQSEVSNIFMTVSGKCQAKVGTYSGNGGNQNIHLGAYPYAVLVNNGIYNVLAIRNGGTENQLTVTGSGFSLNNDNVNISINKSGYSYNYIAFV